MICGNCFKETTPYGSCPYCGHDNETNRLEYPLALPTGSILYGRYVVGRVLGQGGFGITYLARDYRTGEFVAIKEFFPGTMATRNGTTVVPYSGAQGENFDYGKTTFLEEAEIMAEFNGNPHIAGVQLYFEENGTAYFVMEYLDGCNLGVHISRHGGQLSWADTAQVMLPVLKALNDIHAKGVIHRDVAPDNVFITKNGVVKLLDFGAARHSLGNVSQSLDVVIKYGFAPKEQYSRRGRQGPYTDIYAACATIYFALTGVKPAESVDRANRDTLPRPSYLGAKITPAVEHAIMKGLAVEAKDRFQSAAELYSALSGKPFRGASGAKTFVGGVSNDDKTIDGGFHGGTTGGNTSGGTSGSGSSILSSIRSALSGFFGKIGDFLRKARDQLPKNPKVIVLCVLTALLIVLLLFVLLHKHQYGNPTVIQAATCESSGLAQQRCFCGKVETVTLSKKPHTEVSDPGYPATCTSAGMTGGSHCSVCGTITKSQTVLEQLSHDMVRVKAKAATCTESGCTEGSYCALCDYVETESTTVSALGHNFSRNDCTRCDAKEWWVEFTSTKKNYSVGERIEIDYYVRSNEKPPRELLYSNLKAFMDWEATVQMYSRVLWEYPDGRTDHTSPQTFTDRNGSKDIEENSYWISSWDNGVKYPAKGTLEIYNSSNYLLGAYVFYVD